MEAVHLVIKGKVQGVYYRASAKEKADELGIKGWVKNMPGGNVEIVAAGDKEQLDNFIKWCSKGPKHAVVGDVIITQYDGEVFTDFSIKK